MVSILKTIVFNTSPELQFDTFKEHFSSKKKNESWNFCLKSMTTYSYIFHFFFPFQSSSYRFTLSHSTASNHSNKRRTIFPWVNPFWIFPIHSVKLTHLPLRNTKTKAKKVKTMKWNLFKKYELQNYFNNTICCCTAAQMSMKVQF